MKPTTWMPRIWYNSNNSSPEDAVRNEVEINAIAAYLFANAEKHEFAVKNPPRGDAKSGEQIVKSIGCQGCHVVGEGSRDEAGPRAPSASRSRTSATRPPTSGSSTGCAIRSTTARPPTCRTCGSPIAQVADVATFLITLKGAGGDAAKATPDQTSDVDSAPRLLQGVMPFEDAKAEIAKLDPGRSRSRSGSG